MSFPIDHAAKLGPGGTRRSHPINSALIVQRQLIPKCAAGLHSMVPRHMMKPKQKFFRTCLQVGKLLTHGRMILADCVAAGYCPVEAQPECVSLVIIDRIPVFARLRVPPGRWTIM